MVTLQVLYDSSVSGFSQFHFYSEDCQSFPYEWDKHRLVERWFCQLTRNFHANVGLVCSGNPIHCFFIQSSVPQNIRCCSLIRVKDSRFSSEVSHSFRSFNIRFSYADCLATFLEHTAWPFGESQDHCLQQGIEKRRIFQASRVALLVVAFSANERFKTKLPYIPLHTFCNRTH